MRSCRQSHHISSALTTVRASGLHTPTYFRLSYRPVAAPATPGPPGGSGSPANAGATVARGSSLPVEEAGQFRLQLGDPPGRPGFQPRPLDHPAAVPLAV